jgi:osmotically-inducible protein OsmY
VSGVQLPVYYSPMPTTNAQKQKNERTTIMLNEAKVLNGYKLGNFYEGRKFVTALVVVMCLGLVSATCWAAPKEPQKMTDQQITNAVDHRLLSDSALKNNPIDARTDDGIVTLSGTANHLIAKERATMLAQTIRGVRGVVNTISLRIPSLPDDEIRKNVEAALFYDTATDSYDLKTAVKDGVVTINGTVQSYREKQLAMYVAKGVKGVKEVKDSIVVSTRSKRPDMEIAAEVRNIIAIDAWLTPYLIKINVKDGVVTLIGEVGSLAQKERARVLAWTAGVKSVNSDGLLIESWAKAKDQRKETATIKGDPQIKQAVHDSFVFDPRVLSFNPNVEVKNGAVTLTGVVDNLKAKRSAEQDAKNTVGVRRVKNLLKVRPSKPLADDKIEQSVKSALIRNPVVDSYEIVVKTKHGVVTLTGTVDSFFEKAQAEDIASLARGVIDVKNNLTVSYPSVADYYGGYDPYWSFPSYYLNSSPYYYSWPYRSDAEIKEDIEDEMFWSPWVWVHLDNITVTVTNGVATLTGTVSSWFTYYKATENAFEGGASQVINNITIR